MDYIKLLRVATTVGDVATLKSMLRNEGSIRLKVISGDNWIVLGDNSKVLVAMLEMYCKEVENSLRKDGYTGDFSEVPFE